MLLDKKFDVKEFAYVVQLGQEGCCGIFASELSKAMGYSIVGFVDEADFICHFCCQSEQGLIDSKGYGVTFGEVSRNYVHQGSLRLEEYSILEVEAIIEQNTGLGCLNPPGYREAIQRIFQTQFWLAWEITGRKKIAQAIV